MGHNEDNDNEDKGKAASDGGAIAEAVTPAATMAATLAINPARNVSSVLFACNINAVRSAMAEAMVKARFPGRIFTDSCGVAPGQPDGFAIAVMAEVELDLTSHQPKGFDDLDCDFYDVIISFSPEAHARAQDITRNIDCATLYWPVDNLAGLQGSREERLRAYRAVRDDITAKLMAYLPDDGVDEKSGET